MKIEDEDVKVEIVDEEIAKTDGDGPETVEKTDERPVEKVVSAEEGISDLKRKLEEEKNRRIDAERRTREAVHREYAANNEVEDSNLQLVRSAITSLKGNSETLKANYKDAMAIGDYDKVAELQEAMSMNAAQLLQLDQGRRALENRPKAPPPQVQPSDPVEAMASQLSARSADWVRGHPEYVTNPQLHNKMLLAHQLALSDGLQADTDDYFKAVESTLRLRKEPQRAAVREEAAEETDEDAMSQSAQVTQRRTGPPAAPTSRSPSPGVPRSNVVRLTRQEAEHARDMGMSEKEYYTNKQLLKQEGRI